jgi:hypothetical protein
MSKKVKEIEQVIGSLYPNDTTDLLKESVKVVVATDHVSIKGTVVLVRENVVVLYDADSDTVYAVNPKAIRFAAAEGKELVEWYRKRSEALKRVAERDAGLAYVVQKYKEAVEKAARDPSGETK